MRTAPLKPLDIRQPLDGYPYGVRGLCRNWKDGNWAGPRKQILRLHRTIMVVHTFFGEYHV